MIVKTTGTASGLCARMCVHERGAEGDRERRGRRGGKGGEALPGGNGEDSRLGVACAKWQVGTSRGCSWSQCGWGIM